MDLATNRRLTKAFIDVRPVSLVLTPRSRQKKPAGGWAWVAGAPRSPEVFTIIEPSSAPRPTVTLDGIERVVEFEVLGEWGSPMSVGDVFVHSGKDWEVVELWIDNGYETRGLVSARG